MSAKEQGKVPYPKQKACGLTMAAVVKLLLGSFGMRFALSFI